MRSLRYLVSELFMKLLLQWMMYRVISWTLVTVKNTLKISTSIEVFSDILGINASWNTVLLSRVTLVEYLRSQGAVQEKD
jgi:hypothetical protein